ncbi:hypothetical protein MGL_1280 [Malassezia globosa CBS 7966]|uniref:Uncharacterized protein n=1 Tax=Malassezia globosa (strain ATCC MYA-4612 / CBS 7966) TaxID=425265 RepID=A8PX04_MALGO|nr:uncharacterized protein MGL_1280 [Malassezia globosa CBS 7966]EDP44798.1 hypothetical protein MGL_1280 [Malassezia globosa CBS 7966]
MMNEDAGSDVEAARRHLILTEVFGIHPRAIVDALVVSANEHLYIQGQKLEETVCGLLGDTEQAEKLAEESVHSVMTLLEHAIDHTMDTFELYCLRSIFVVTPEQSQYMTMAHHRGLDLRPSCSSQLDPTPEEEHASDEVPIVTDIEDQLLRRIACARATQHRLAQAEAAAKVRLERMNMVQRTYEFILEGAEKLNAGNDGDTSSAVLNIADDVMSQVYGVMEALDTLMGAEPFTATLSMTSSEAKDVSEREGMVDAKREWEKGRDEYLNWEAQRIIANMKRSPT